MRPTTAHDNVFDFNALLHPGTVFEHPKDVVCHNGLKRPRSVRFSHPGRRMQLRSRPAHPFARLPD